MNENVFTGIDRTELARVLDHGIDHGGNPIEPYVDDVGGWPVRCCLGFSEVGDRMALIAWSPMDWKGVYAETGPIFVHAEPCPGPIQTDRLPAQLDQRPMVLRPYTHDHRIAYDHVQHVPEGGSLTELVADLLELEDVAFVHGRNVRGGCYSFDARRVSAT